MYEDAHQETDSRFDMDGPGPDLRPCPFCGEAELVHPEVLDEHTHDPSHVVACDSCGTVGPPSDESVIAADLWNGVRLPMAPEEGRRVVRLEIETNGLRIERDRFRDALEKLRDAADVHAWIDHSETMGWGLADALNEAGAILDGDEPGEQP